MTYDPELHAMSLVYDALKDLDGGQQSRIIRWVWDRLSTSAPEMAVRTTTPGAQIPASAAVSQDATAVKEVVRQDIKDYDKVLDLFAESTVKRSTSKVLLMAAYLQERHSFKEISSYEINFRLKRIGQTVTNISSLINSLLNRKPHLLVQIGADTHKKQARRKFRVTEEGLKVARSFLKH